MDASADLEFQIIGKKPTIKKLDTIVTINEMECKIVRVNWKSGTYDYYYNSAFLKIDYKLFENHIYDGWAAFLKISNSLPIKIVKSTNGLATVTLTLIRHSNETIDNKIFEIPKLIPDKDINIFKIPNTELMRIEQ